MYQPSEASVEKFLREQIIKLGGEAYKFTSPGRRGVLDRLCVLPHGVIAFVEVKKPGKRPTDRQAREIQRLIKKGHIATFVDSTLSVLALVKQLQEAINGRITNSQSITQNEQLQREERALMEELADFPGSLKGYVRSVQGVPHQADPLAGPKLPHD